MDRGTRREDSDKELETIDVESKPVPVNVVEPSPSGMPYGMPAITPGRHYLIMHAQGGQSELDAKDDIQMTDKGIVARHNDPARTFTFYPWYNIIWIREFVRK